MKSLGGVALALIRNSPLSHIRAVGAGMEIYTDKYSCLDKTFRTRFTCIIYRAYIDYMMEVRYWKVKDPFHISDFVTPPVGSAWAVTKWSPLRPWWDEASNTILEMGLGEKYLDEYQSAHAKGESFSLPGEEDEGGEGPTSLQVGNLYAPFCFL